MPKVTDRSLVKVRMRVERWRQTGGGRGSRIPDQLWADAVGVAREHGVYATSKALRFNYYSLKERLDQGSTAPKKKTRRKNGPSGANEAAQGTAPHFVEMPMGCFAGAAGRAVIELLGERGDRMRIEVVGSSQVDMVGLTQAFWRRER